MTPRILPTTHQKTTEFQPKTPFPKLVPEQIHQSKNDRLDLLFTMALTAHHGNAVRPKKTIKHEKTENTQKLRVHICSSAYRFFARIFGAKPRIQKARSIPTVYGKQLRNSASKRTFEKSSAMTPKKPNSQELVINQFDAVSELLLEITLKGNAL